MVANLRLARLLRTETNDVGVEDNCSAKDFTTLFCTSTYLPNVISRITLSFAISQPLLLAWHLTSSFHLSYLDPSVSSRTSFNPANPTTASCLPSHNCFSSHPSLWCSISCTSTLESCGPSMLSRMPTLQLHSPRDGWCRSDIASVRIAPCGRHINGSGL